MGMVGTSIWPLFASRENWFFALIKLCRTNLRKKSAMPGISVCAAPATAAFFFGWGLCTRLFLCASFVLFKFLYGMRNLTLRTGASWICETFFFWRERQYQGYHSCGFVWLDTFLLLLIFKKNVILHLMNLSMILWWRILEGGCYHDLVLSLFDF